MLAMATSGNKAMASGLLLCLLLLHSGMAVVGGDDCWFNNNADYPICFHQPKCRGHCQDKGNADGRCNKKFPNLVPICECLRPNCN
ncbi:hypothetical protein BAE44_0026405 [Dichanthelium oligosanthes]|uniref:Knottin scorpion toxin-like domain-containing protein n=1 Tax=Dichanthelium oligosanthes TaxID=888268 RepID=A0A1E5UI80_9POAL|nr:hypothetical protein BAE44_0026405 [Dichanthelium oligosanthes]